MPKFIKIICLLSLLCCSCSFGGAKKSRFVFINQSDKAIDSVAFKINNLSFTIDDISAHSSKSRYVSMDSILSNKHDVTVTASVYAAGTLVKETFYYNDLSAKIDSEYTLTLRENLTTLLE